MTNPFQSIKELVQNAKELGKAATNLSKAAQNLQVTINDSQSALNDIQKDVEEFNFKTQPRLERIKELQTKMQAEIDKLGNTK